MLECSAPLKTRIRLSAPSDVRAHRRRVELWKALETTRRRCHKLFVLYLFRPHLPHPSPHLPTCHKMVLLVLFQTAPSHLLHSSLSVTPASHSTHHYFYLSPCPPPPPQLTARLSSVLCTVCPSSLSAVSL